MAFVKLDCGILDSTLWADRDAKDLFITALLMAAPHELVEPMEQIRVRSLEKTGFVIPPGWYGMVRAAGQGIVRRHGMEMEAGLAALERLGAPEPDSRTPDFEGRRLARVDGGYIVLNFKKYRDKDHTSAERSRRYRANQSTSPKKIGRKSKPPPDCSAAYNRALEHNPDADANDYPPR
jgi:hypothetical protein